MSTCGGSRGVWTKQNQMWFAGFQSEPGRGKKWTLVFFLFFFLSLKMCVLRRSQRAERSSLLWWVHMKASGSLKVTTPSGAKLPPAEVRGSRSVCACVSWGREGGVRSSSRGCCCVARLERPKSKLFNWTFTLSPPFPSSQPIRSRRKTKNIITHWLRPLTLCPLKLSFFSLLFLLIWRLNYPGSLILPKYSTSKQAGGQQAEFPEGPFLQIHLSASFTSL